MRPGYAYRWDGAEWDIVVASERDWKGARSLGLVVIDGTVCEHWRDRTGQDWAQVFFGRGDARFDGGAAAGVEAKT